MSFAKMIPVIMAMPKLTSVPIKTYSVSLRLFASFKSPNRNTDLAAIKNPTPSGCPEAKNANTKSRSKIPMYFPALCSDSSSASVPRKQAAK